VEGEKNQGGAFKRRWKRTKNAKRFSYEKKQLAGLTIWRASKITRTSKGEGRMGSEKLGNMSREKELEQRLPWEKRTGTDGNQQKKKM